MVALVFLGLSFYRSKFSFLLAPCEFTKTGGKGGGKGGKRGTDLNPRRDKNGNSRFGCSAARGYCLFLNFTPPQRAVPSRAAQYAVLQGRPQKTRQPAHAMAADTQVGGEKIAGLPKRDVGSTNRVELC